MMERLAEGIIRFRYLIIITVTVITVVMAYFMKDLEVDADVLGYLPDDDPTAMLFDRIGETYGGNEMVIVGLETDHVFEKEMLEVVKQVTDSIRSVPGIGYVTSLTNVIDIRDTEYGIDIGRLVDEYDIPESREELDSLKEYTLSKEMYRGVLVSEDATATLVSGRIRSDADQDEVVKKIIEKVDAIPFDGTVYYAGMPVTLHELHRIIISDVRYLAPLAFVLISLVLLAGFRNVRGVFLPMFTVLIAIVWVMGIMTLTGHKITMMTNIIPVILLAVGSAYAIHVVNAIMAEHQINPEQALQRAVAYIVIPVILASVTTIFGFLSFIPGSYLIMIREFGIFSAAGIFCALLLSATFVPAIIAVIGKGTRPAEKKDSLHIFDTIPQGLSMLVFSYPKTLLTVWIFLLAVSFLAMTRIERRVEIIDYFQEDNRARQGEQLMDDKFYGTSPLYITFSGDVQNPELLQMMSRSQDEMEQFDYIPYTQSVADLIKEMNEVMEERRIVPDEPAKISQLWFLLEGQEIMDQLVSRDLREGIIQGFVTSNELEVITEIENHFKAYVEEHSTEAYRMDVTGIPIMFKRLDDSIIRSQTYSLIIAMLLVIMMTSLLLRSFERGVIAVIPIGVTVIVLFGAMGLTGIPLDIATVLTGSVTIGIGIDYAIHFISRYQAEYTHRSDVTDSIDKAIRISGKAIVINMAAVSVGFAMLMFSRLMPLQRFGFLIAVTMLVAAMATLTLLPMVLKKQQEWRITRDKQKEKKHKCSSKPNVP